MKLIFRGLINFYIYYEICVSIFIKYVFVTKSIFRELLTFVTKFAFLGLII